MVEFIAIDGCCDKRGFTVYLLLTKIKSITSLLTFY